MVYLRHASYFYLQGMDKKLVEMLKEKIIFPSKVGGMDTETKLNSINYRTNSRTDHTTMNSKQPGNLPVSEQVSKLQSDNNATIAIKILYDSCMKEGKKL